MLRRLFENFEEAVGRFLHEGGAGEDGEGAAGFDGRAEIGVMDDLANLAELDEELRRIGGDDEDVRMGLDEDARLFLVGFAQVVAGGNGFGYAIFEIGRGRRCGRSWRTGRSSRASRPIRWDGGS